MGRGKGNRKRKGPKKDSFSVTLLYSFWNLNSKFCIEKAEKRNLVLRKMQNLSTDLLNSRTLLKAWLGGNTDLCLNAVCVTQVSFNSLNTGVSLRFLPIDRSLLRQHNKPESSSVAGNFSHQKLKTKYRLSVSCFKKDEQLIVLKDDSVTRQHTQKGMESFVPARQNSRLKKPPMFFRPLWINFATASCIYQKSVGVFGSGETEK